MSRVYVWDLFVRIFHWTVVLCVFLNFFVTTEGDLIHEFLGYTAAAFVIARIVWGFIGSPAARFKTFFRGPRKTLAYLQNFKSRHHELSHNPLAAWVMLFLMACILGLATTGYMMGTDRYFGEDWVQELHFWIGNVMMAFVGLHILGVLYESYSDKQNLVASMIHGYKRSPSDSTEKNS